MRSYEHRITTDYHQFVVYNGVSSDNLPEYTRDGLTKPYEGGVAILTGRTYGPVAVRTELHGGEPAAEPPPIWTEVSELSVNVAAGPLVLGELMAGPVAGMPDLAFSGPRWYRLRISARGRDESSLRGQQSDDPLEHFLLEVWPAPDAPPVLLRHSDEVGRSFRNESPPDSSSDEPSEAALRAFRELVTALPAVASVRDASIVSHESTVRAPRSRVAAALREAAFLPFWFGDGGQPVVDGKWTSFLSSQQDITLRGEVRYRAGDLDLAWDWTGFTAPTPHDPFPRLRSLLASPTEVSIDIRDHAGDTRVAVHHKGLPGPLRQPMESLWRYYVERLGVYCETGALPRHPWN